jgi:hypothetical protein
MNDMVYSAGDRPFKMMIMSLFMPVPSTASAESVIYPAPTEVLIDESCEEAEDYILATSPVIPHLIALAKKEPVSADWEREIDDI